ncbi:MAG: DUF2306 domain-containing protein [Alphaproteobacteria bacterium]
MNVDIFLGASPVIIIHTLCAFAALGTGIAVWRARKGTKAHKALGRIFVMLMAVTAFSAIFIRLVNKGQFSFIHLFVPLTFFAIWQAIYYIRKGDIRRHKKAVKGMFFGALLIPGILSFLPGRLMWMVFFG